MGPLSQRGNRGTEWASQLELGWCSTGLALMGWQLGFLSPVLPRKQGPHRHRTLPPSSAPHVETVTKESQILVAPLQLSRWGHPPLDE